MSDFEQFLRQAQKVLTATATDYSVGTLITALGLGFLAAPLAMINAGLSVSRVWLSVISMISVLHSLTMLGSSFVEEEHQFWYWGTTSVVILLWACLYRYHHEASSARRGLFAVAIIALLLRIFRRWNQTGQKWITEPDIKKVLLVGRPSVLWTMVIYTYIDVALRMSNHGFQALGNEFAVIAALSITTAALGFKFSHTMNDAPELIKGCPSFLINIYDSIPLSSQAQTVFFFLIAAALYTFGADLWAKVRNGHASHHHGVDQMGHDLLTVFLITQSRLTNIPVFLLFRVMSLLIRALFRNDPSAGGMSCLILIMQQVSFFALGGSNAISSVDLSNAYNGITNYNAFGVGLLTFVSNWAGPIWWTSECVLQLSMQTRARTSRAASKILETGAEPSWEAWVVFANLATVFTSLTAVGTMIACLLLRHHLFVWTVFSPKYLYVIAWGIPMHLGINLGLGSFMYWLESLKDREERSEPILAS